MSTSPSASNEIVESRLPREYDKLISADKLKHGEHNPRKETPSPELKRSIANDGIAHPLIVRPDPNREIYHITDGWQRYQAGTQAGMEQLPVIIYDTPLEALTATETESIVNSWTTYDRARYYRSLADEVGEPDESTHSVAAKVTEITNKDRTKTTVQRYLDVLSLPDEVHPLLNDGPSGTPQQWAALQNYNPDVRQYGSLRWTTAAKIARCEESIADRRLIGVAAIAVVFEDSSQAEEFVVKALDNPRKNLDIIRKQVQLGESYSEYLRIPRTDLQLDAEEKQAVIEYCRRNRLSLSSIIKDTVRDIAHQETDGKAGDENAGQTPPES